MAAAASRSATDFSRHNEKGRTSLGKRGPSLSSARDYALRKRFSPMLSVPRFSFPSATQPVSPSK